VPIPDVGWGARDTSGLSHEQIHRWVHDGADPVALADARDRHAARGSELRAAGRRLEAARGALNEGWAGRDADAAGSRVRALSDRMVRLGDDLAGQARGLDGMRVALERVRAAVGPPRPAVLDPLVGARARRPAVGGRGAPRRRFRRVPLRPRRRGGGPRRLPHLSRGDRRIGPGGARGARRGPGARHRELRPAHDRVGGPGSPGNGSVRGGDPGPGGASRWSRAARPPRHHRDRRDPDPGRHRTGGGVRGRDDVHPSREPVRGRPDRPRRTGSYRFSCAGVGSVGPHRARAQDVVPGARRPSHPCRAVERLRRPAPGPGSPSRPGTPGARGRRSARSRGNATDTGDPRPGAPPVGGAHDGDPADPVPVPGRRPRGPRRVSTARPTPRTDVGTPAATAPLPGGGRRGGRRRGGRRRPRVRRPSGARWGPGW